MSLGLWTDNLSVTAGTLLLVVGLQTWNLQDDVSLNKLEK